MDNKDTSDIGIYTDYLEPALWEFFDYLDTGYWDGYSIIPNTDCVEAPTIWKLWDALNIRPLSQFQRSFMQYAKVGDCVLVSDCTWGIIEDIMRNNDGCPLCYKIQYYDSTEFKGSDWMTALGIIWWEGWPERYNDYDHSGDGALYDKHSYDDTYGDWGRERRMDDESYADWFSYKKDSESTKEFLDRYPYSDYAEECARLYCGDKVVDDFKYFVDWAAGGSNGDD